MEQAMYYVFCAMTLMGALGVLMLRGYVNAAMSMLVSMLGAAGLLILMHAYFLAFLMVSVYAGAVLVLFVFVVMLVGDRRDEGSIYKRFALLGLWVAAGVIFAFFQSDLAKYATSPATEPTFIFAKNYGIVLFTKFILPFQVAGALLLAAMIGVMAIAKPSERRIQKKETL